jgi:tetratricopeptide (TPR) repeat protein
MPSPLPSGRGSESNETLAEGRPPASEGAPLERDVPLSHSLIWRRQREFYAQRGLKAWREDRVPEYITNNPFITEIYARIVAEFLGECMVAGGEQNLSAQRPLRILELGSGSGKFSYLFLRQLGGLLPGKNIPLNMVRYVMTDCSENIVADWRSNTYLAEFVAGGILEFAVYQAGEEGGNSGPGLAAGTGPLVVIANYVFDSLPQDAFIVTSNDGASKDGESQIFEALATTTAASSDSGQAGGTLSTLRLSYKNVELAPNRFPEPAWNAILEQYRKNLPAGATFLFPTQALKTLQELARLGDGRMLVLAADKGFAYEDQLALCQGPPVLEFHSADCFSQMVNLDALGKYFQSTGGGALRPGKHHTGLSLCAFLQGRPGDTFPTTESVYRESQTAFGPDDLFTLLAWLNAHMEEMSVAQILAALRLTRWDTTAFLRFFPILARQLRNVAAERVDLRDAVMKVWVNRYPVTASDNVLAFDCGVVLLELRFFDEAAAMFKESQKMLGPSAATSYNLGLCAHGLGRRAESLAFMVEACNLDPNFEPARQSRLKLEKES